MNPVSNDLKLMTKTKKVYLPARRGSILAYALIILAIMLSIVAAISVAAVIEKKSASSTDASVQTFQTADSCVQLAIKKINDAISDISNPDPSIESAFDQSCNSDHIIENLDGIPADAGSCDVSFYDSDNNLIENCGDSGTVSGIARIKSIGKYKGTIRAVSVSIGN